MLKAADSSFAGWPTDPHGEPSPFGRKEGPERYLRTPAAIARFGDRVDRLAPFLWQTDPLADDAVAALADHPQRAALIDRVLRASPGDTSALADAPPALRALMTAAWRVPFWVDWPAVDRGGRVLVRAGIIGGLVLGAKALIYGYASPGGNKPLMFSGQLKASAPRRLNETSRFVRAVTQAGGMRAGADGFVITLKVRLMHAQVRRMILSSGRWQAERWGAPINQHDMAATTLLFSSVTMEGLRQFGLSISAQESTDYMHLWRYVGHLMGVTEELLPTSEADGVAFTKLIESTHAQPDDDSRALVRALLESGEHDRSATDEERATARKTRPLVYGICRGLLGDKLADALGVPATRMRHVVPAVRAMYGALELARQRSPRLADALLRRGQKYWDMVVARGLGAATQAFALPERLGGLDLGAFSG
ncbi:MAG TPA: oxygenase MpaB family protein [Polyangia bacterium]|nr:oxygenase MpaB family protein [Polyangia bacterium]